ncbi:MarR family winged helix-turn-helix transcriptional regulator [Paenibacillus alba]|uniref:MarR family transcriptional regulator n=1 Tax=Paenibacillus alba TaxID=1197127 RepID=A0ABU6FV22_9BACL|nr:MarR family transcriptional regulator [Paenibacillus alba]MEC0225724.1 MarR family transcriptional regulator [Paenibacillus alba]NQX66039.1 MarR family transcriptional regulator [Paenibacillus alba]
MNEKQLPKYVYEQLALFRYRIRKFIRFSEEAARGKGLTPQYHQLMLSIMGFPERDYATPKELAERLQITPHACAELIKRCEEMVLVQRLPNPEDKRSIFIRLTEYGMGILEELSEIHVDELTRAGLLEFHNHGASE